MFACSIFVARVLPLLLAGCGLAARSSSLGMFTLHLHTRACPGSVGGSSLPDDTRAVGEHFALGVACGRRSCVVWFCVPFYAFFWRWRLFPVGAPFRIAWVAVWLGLLRGAHSFSGLVAVLLFWALSRLWIAGGGLVVRCGGRALF